MALDVGASTTCRYDTGATVRGDSDLSKGLSVRNSNNSEPGEEMLSRPSPAHLYEMGNSDCGYHNQRFGQHDDVDRPWSYGDLPTDTGTHYLVIDVLGEKH
eukprot:10894994-Karenia_brevis.AAC.1